MNEPTLLDVRLEYALRDARGLVETLDRAIALTVPTGPTRGDELDDYLALARVQRNHTATVGILERLITRRKE